MCLMSIIKNQTQTKKIKINNSKNKRQIFLKIFFVLFFKFFFFVKRNGYKRGAPWEEHTRKESVIT